MVNGTIISSAQVRAARAWLSWSQDDLAAKAGISQQSVVRYELGRTVPHDGTLANLRKAFEAAGIRFQFDGMSAKGIRVE
jgi:transcriptional regulator with XRE-family HTH domain